MALGTSGWKARQERARMKNINSKQDRIAIREARKAHYAKQIEQAKQDEKAAQELQERIDAAVDTLKSGGHLESVDVDNAVDSETEKADISADIPERDQLTAQLDDLGVRWHPRMKDETLKGLLDEAKESDA